MKHIYKSMSNSVIFFFNTSIVASPLPTSFQHNPAPEDGRGEGVGEGGLLVRPSCPKPIMTLEEPRKRSFYFLAMTLFNLFQDRIHCNNGFE